MRELREGAGHSEEVAQQLKERFGADGVARLNLSSLKDGTQEPRHVDALVWRGVPDPLLLTLPLDDARAFVALAPVILAGVLDG